MTFSKEKDPVSKLREFLAQNDPERLLEKVQAEGPELGEDQKEKFKRKFNEGMTTIQTALEVEEMKRRVNKDLAPFQQPFEELEGGAKG